MNDLYDYTVQQPSIWLGQPHIGGLTTTTTTGSTPQVNVVTSVVRTMAGFRGQVLVKGEIVWESNPRKDSAEALRAAERQVTDSLKRVFE